jgi:lactoylglutathione lyase
MPDYRYDHLHLISPDPVTIAHFYEDFFGAVIQSVRTLSDGRTNVELDLAGWRFMVIDRRTPEEAALLPEAVDSAFGHICLRTDDLTSTAARLQAAGVPISEVKSPHPGVKVLFLRGPDNVIIELSERDG